MRPSYSWTVLFLSWVFIAGGLISVFMSHAHGFEWVWVARDMGMETGSWAFVALGTLGLCAGESLRTLEKRLDWIEGARSAAKKE